MAKINDGVARVRCPYCRERVDLVVDPETLGQYVEDCAVCCRPWAVSVSEGENGQRTVDIQPAQ